ncbi:MAG TPA: class I SAM-dependent methyltransferase [Paludibacteraceae bacterium]|nr:class I SAM-dependent methyltransferase [Paludibacteraceae bacterium]
MDVTGERLIPGFKSFSELEHLNRYYFVVNQINLTGKKVLDIASGEGYGSNILANYAEKVTGVDISPEAIAHAQKVYNRNNLEYIQGNATKIPLTDKSIDVVVSFETIEHLEEQERMMEEICRVMKSEGILIISSPDKYYYSDVPNFKNEFHVKELYYEEFKNLISRYFQKSIFFSQRNFGGSIIALDQDKSTYNKPLVVENNGESHSFLPEYNIAIATNDLKFTIPHQILMYTEQKRVITKFDIENAVYEAEMRLRKSITWKTGYYILYPLKKIKRMFRKE